MPNKGLIVPMKGNVIYDYYDRKYNFMSIQMWWDLDKEDSLKINQEGRLLGRQLYPTIQSFGKEPLTVSPHHRGLLARAYGVSRQSKSQSGLHG